MDDVTFFGGILNGMVIELIILIIIVTVPIVVMICQKKTEAKRNKLLNDILNELGITVPKTYDDELAVNSFVELKNYTDIRYLKENDNIAYVQEQIKSKQDSRQKIIDFLKENSHCARSQYKWAAKMLQIYADQMNQYTVKIWYISGNQLLHITPERMNEIAQHPEWLMSNEKYGKNNIQQ